ncbi:MAG: amino acid ABC transporter substrate-binding protein [Alphaproteobacteria bacterium]|nr:amino acid ABC transporter substrate-binding protein [Alphaproteobacteria bacterium]TAD87694.1 MAG: amino acid ABC transporter substrate-binding protein [Alphaproteobacteria bacterium]
MKSLALATAVLGTALVAAVPVQAGAILDQIRARGDIRCGIPQPTAGWAAPDNRGVMRGMDADTCRAVAAALFGDAGKVNFVTTTSANRFPALQNGEVDMLARVTTWTFSRDTTLGFNFAPPIFYDGQGLMVSARSGIKSARELDGATVCVQPGTTTELNLADYFRSNNMRFNAVVIESSDEIRAAFFSGRCDVYTTDRSALASARAVAPDPRQYVVLPEVISKEPLAPLVRHGDDQLFDIVKWTVFALIEAEEMGLTQANVERMAAETKDPAMMRFLGREAGFSRGAQLADNWVINVIKAVGNYGEMYERNLGADTPLGLSRGVNNLWTKGGLMYSPPFR